MFDPRSGGPGYPDWMRLRALAAFDSSVAETKEQRAEAAAAKAGCCSRTVLRWLAARAREASGLGRAVTVRQERRRKLQGLMLMAAFLYLGKSEPIPAALLHADSRGVIAGCFPQWPIRPPTRGTWPCFFAGSLGPPRLKSRTWTCTVPSTATASPAKSCTPSRWSSTPSGWLPPALSASLPSHCF